MQSLLSCDKQEVHHVTNRVALQVPQELVCILKWLPVMLCPCLWAPSKTIGTQIQGSSTPAKSASVAQTRYPPRPRVTDGLYNPAYKGLQGNEQQISRLAALELLQKWVCPQDAQSSLTLDREKHTGPLPGNREPGIAWESTLWHPTLPALAQAFESLEVLSIVAIPETGIWTNSCCGRLAQKISALHVAGMG